MVIVEVPVPDTDVGVKVTVTPAGGALVVRVTVWVGPDPATFTAVLALLPRFTLALAGLREMAKDCAGEVGDADASFDPAEVPPALVEFT